MIAAFIQCQVAIGTPLVTHTLSIWYGLHKSPVFMYHMTINVEVVSSSLNH